jgi:hypothetical protein
VNSIAPKRVTPGAGAWAVTGGSAQVMRATAAGVVLLTLCASFACHRTPPAIDPDMAAYIPADTLVLAGVDVDSLRSSRLAGALPTPPGASKMLAAWNGKDLLLVSAAKSAKTPTLTGSPAAVKSATAQHLTGKPGAPQLLALASAIPNGRQIWVVAKGAVALPLTGNLANLNRVLALSDSVTLAAHVDTAAQLNATLIGRSPEAAQQLEQSLRAILTLAGMAARWQPDVAAALGSIEVRRDDRTVGAGLSTTPETATKLLQELLP